MYNARFEIGDKVQQSWPGEGGQGPIYTVVGFDKDGWLILDDGDTMNPKTMLLISVGSSSKHR